jgi:hypothetical protein
VPEKLSAVWVRNPPAKQLQGFGWYALSLKLTAKLAFL